MIKIKDKNNSEPNIGDMIISAYLSYKSAYIRIGKIIDFTPAGYLKFETEDKVTHLCKSNQYYILNNL